VARRTAAARLHAPVDLGGRLHLLSVLQQDIAQCRENRAQSHVALHRRVDGDDVVFLPFFVILFQIHEFQHVMSPLDSNNFCLNKYLREVQVFKYVIVGVKTIPRGIAKL
jgi:hypothetical protein